MKYRLKLTAILAAILCLVLAGNAFASYVLGESTVSSKFVDANKTGSVWTIGYGPNDTSNNPTITTFQYRQIASLGLYGWCYNNDNDAKGNFLKNCSSTTYDNNTTLSSYWKPGDILVGTPPDGNTKLFAQFTAPSAGTYYVDIYCFGRSLKSNAGVPAGGGTTADVFYYEKGIFMESAQIRGFEGGSALIPNAYGDSPTHRFGKEVTFAAGEKATVGINNGGDNPVDENLGLSFVVYASGEYSKVTGTVKSTSGVAVKDATVTIGSNSATTDSTGTYSIAITPGTYTATVTRANYTSASESITLAAGATTKNFTITPVATEATISGTVTDANGTAVRELIVCI